MKSKLEIYALAVCFASVVCLVITSGFAGYSLFKILAPEITMSSHIYDQYQTNDAYWRSPNKYKHQRNKKEQQIKKPNEKELTQERLEAFSVEVKREQRLGMRKLIENFIFIFSASIALFIHWRIASKARE